MSLTDADIALVRSSVTMRELARAYGYTPNRAGKIICPFHKDTNPSMQIYGGSRGYYCFVCHSGGDVIDFVQKHDHLEFEQAVRHLAKEFSIPISDGDTKLSKPDMDRIAKRKARQEAERERIEMLKDRMKKLSRLLMALESVQAQTEPLGDVWCVVTNRIDKYQGQWEMLFDEVHKRK